jgi:beta-lactamase regulating signal transducer with metallopeptidase domain
MAPQPASLDAAFGVLLSATARWSLVACAVLAARRLLRRRLAPGARYALWALLALPLLAPLLPAVPVPFPATQPDAPAQPAPAPAADAGWRVEYGGLGQTVRPAPRVETAPINWRLPAAGAWALGVVVLGVRVLSMHARAVLRTRRARPVVDPDVLHLLDRCRALVRLRRSPRVVVAPPGTGPAVMGLLRPRLLLPADAPASLSRAELRFVLLHELVHLKRGDLLSEWLLTLLQLAQWFNPVIWLASSRVRADREEACDAAVLSLTGREARHDYGRTILRLATELSLSPRPSPAVGILETRSSLERRLRMIAAEDRPTRRWPAALVAAVALTLVAATNAQQPPAKTRTAPTEWSATPATATPGDASTPRSEWTGVDPARRARPDAGKQGGETFVVNRQLGRKLPEVNFNNVALSDAVDFLRDVTGANVFVNWKALHDAGVERTSPVSARMRDVSFGKALTILLDGVERREPLGYTVAEGVITITSRADLEKDVVTRVYDVRDLIVPIPDYEPPAVEDMKANRPRPLEKPQTQLEKDADAERTRQAAIDRVEKLIKETVEPPVWEKTSRLRELNGQLIITAPPRLQEEIAGLIGQLRETRAVQVCVEARFLAVDDEVLAALPPDLRRTVDGELRAAKDPVRVGAGDVKPPDKAPEPPAKDAPKVVVLDRGQVDQLLKAVQASAHSTTVTAPRITLFNGQGAYVMVATSRAYPADYIVIKENDGRTRYEPQVAVVQAGVMFWARATAGADRTFATLSLRPRLTQLVGMDTVPWDRSPPDQKLTVQRPNLLSSELATTVSVPDGKTLLMGGLRGYFGPEAKAHDGAVVEAKADTRPQNVLLLVKPTLIVQREVEMKALPLINQKKHEKMGEPGR